MILTHPEVSRTVQHWACSHVPVNQGHKSSPTVPWVAVSSSRCLGRQGTGPVRRKGGPNSLFSVLGEFEILVERFSHLNMIGGVLVDDVQARTKLPPYS